MTIANTDPGVETSVRAPDSTTDGAGWRYFAGTILGIAGIMRILDSIWAFRFSGSLPDGLQDGVLGSNLTAYAWVWLGVGIIMIFASFMVLVQSQFARWIGIIAASIGIVSAATWLPYYPVWSLVYVLLGALVLYALCAYGGPAQS